MDEAEYLDEEQIGLDIEIPKRFPCPEDCTKMFKTQYDLILHLAHEHKLSSLTCNQCSLKFNKLKKFEKHLKSHREDNKLFYEMMDETNNKDYEMIQEAEDYKFQCNNCKKCFKLKRNFEKHKCFRTRRSKSNPNPEFQCQICSSIFNSRKECFEHQSSHTDGILDCNLCDKKFKTTNGLKYHLHQHLKQKNYSCFYCQKDFSANVNLIAHIKTIHSTLKDYNCPEIGCNRSFATMDHYTKHIKVHQNIRNYECNECQKKFLQKCHLTEHIRTQHKPMSGFKCSFCDQVISTKYTLVRHVLMKHNNITDF